MASKKDDNSRPQMSDKIYQSKRRIMLVFSIPMVGFLIYRLLLLAPQIFPAFLGVILITIVLALGYRFIRQTVAMKCVTCGGAMVDMGILKAIKGALDSDDGSKLDSIGKRVYRCERCGNEYHELIYYSSSSGDAADYAKDMKASEVILTVMGNEVPGSQKTLNSNEMSREEYRALKKQLAEEVTLHNLRNGFNKKPIKIDLDE